MSIKIVCIGKLNTEFSKVFEYYKSRLSHYSMEVVELKEKGHLAKELQVEKESEELEKYINKNTFILDALGRECSTEEFKELVDSNKETTFIIGGSYGITKNVKEKCMCLSLSKLSLTHQFSRVILMEQIYRIDRIFLNHPYHH